MTQLRRVVVGNKREKPTTTPNFQIGCPPPKRLSLEVVVVVVNKRRKKLTTTRRFHINLDEPPSIEEVCARIPLTTVR